MQLKVNAASALERSREIQHLPAGGVRDETFARPSCGFAEMLNTSFRPTLCLGHSWASLRSESISLLSMRSSFGLAHRGVIIHTMHRTGNKGGWTKIMEAPGRQAIKSALE
jgi:hypothetical protein